MDAQEVSLFETLYDEFNAGKVNFYGYDLDNGNGYFDLDKYTKIMY